MSRRSIPITKVLGLFLVALPATALPYDFVFTVPIEIRNVHADVHGVEFACEVMNGAGEVVGRGGARASVERKPGRVLEEAVSVRFNARPGRRAAEATRYRCFINYLQASSVPQAGEPGSAQADERFRAAPGSEFVREVQGKL